jgi:hypothetical protein
MLTNYVKTDLKCKHFELFYQLTQFLPTVSPFKDEQCLVITKSVCRESLSEVLFTSPWCNVITLFTTVIYCHHNVMLSFSATRQY